MAVNIPQRNVNIHAYTFEAINKGKYTEKLIESFDHLEKIQNNPFSPTVHIGTYDYSVKLHQWKITDLSGTLNEIERDNTNLLNRASIRILKNAVSMITVTICEAEFLPFNYIILHFELNSQKSELNKSYRNLSGLLNPLLYYWLPFEGRFSSDYEHGFAVPAFYQIKYNNEAIKQELTQIMENLQQYPQNSDVKEYVENCNKLKQYFLFENMKYDPISMLKIQDEFHILGNLNDSSSNFASVFSLEPTSFRYTGDNPFFTENSFFGTFPSLFFPYLLLVSPIFWLRTSRQKLIQYRTQLNQFKIEYKTEDYLNSDIRKELSQIFDLDNNLNFLLSELNELKIMNKIFNNYFLKRPEIIDKSIILDIYDANKKTDFENRVKYSYVSSCNLSFQDIITEIEKDAKEIQDDLSFIKNRIGFLQNKKDEDTKSKQNRIIIASTIASAVVAIILAIDVIHRWFVG